MIAPILRVFAFILFTGAILFLIPFLIFKAMIFFLFAGLAFSIFGRRRFRRNWRNEQQHFDHYEDLTPYPSRERMQDPLHQQPKQI